MSKQTQSPSAWMIALGVFIVFFVLLMIVGYSFIAALFFALVVAAALAAYMLFARDRSRVAHSDARPADRGRPATATTDTARVAPDASERRDTGSPDSPGTVATAAPLVSSPATAVRHSADTPRAAASRESAPVRLDSAREGGPDDLKRIKGVGPKIEDRLNQMGIFHLDQIASWGSAEIAWMDENLEDFRGRVSRDDWVGQARLLATGGDTDVFPPGGRG